MRKEMEDRKASFMAAAMGGVAIGGFWLAQPGQTSVPLRLLEQRTFAAGGVGLDRDAAAAFRIELPNVLREAIEDNLAVVFQVVGRDGSVYPLAPMTDPLYSGALKLPVGYANTPVSPRLEAVVGNRTMASVPLRELPPANPVQLGPATDAPIRLVYRGDPWLDVVSKRPLRDDERWKILAHRTRFASGLEAWAELPSRMPRWPSHRLNIPFPDQAGAVELDLVRLRQTQVSTIVRLKGMRLEKRFGGTALVVDQTTPIPNSMGATVLLLRQDLGPRRPLRKEDPRSAAVSLSALPPWVPPNFGQDMPRRDRLPKVEILSPSPESLGLRELRIGSGYERATAKNVGPLREGLFEAVVKITFVKPVPIEKRTIVVPIELGRPNFETTNVSPRPIAPSPS